MIAKPAPSGAAPRKITRGNSDARGHPTAGTAYSNAETTDSGISAPLIAFPAFSSEFWLLNSDFYFKYPFCPKYPIASSVLLNTFAAVSVTNGDGIARHIHTT